MVLHPAPLSTLIVGELATKQIYVEDAGPGGLRMPQACAGGRVRCTAGRIFFKICMVLLRTQGTDSILRVGAECCANLKDRASLARVPRRTPGWTGRCRGTLRAGKMAYYNIMVAYKFLNAESLLCGESSKIDSQVCRPQAEKKVQWQAAEGEEGFAAAKEELKREEEEDEEDEEDEEEINGSLLPQDLSKLDVAALTPLTPEVIRSESYYTNAQSSRELRALLHVYLCD